MFPKNRRARLLTKESMKPETAKWRAFDKTVRQVRKAFANMPVVELDELFREAIKTVRKN